jgi:hypothetical protein
VGDGGGGERRRFSSRRGFGGRNVVGQLEHHHNHHGFCETMFSRNTRKTTAWSTIRPSHKVCQYVSLCVWVSACHAAHCAGPRQGPLGLSSWGRWGSGDGRRGKEESVAAAGAAGIPKLGERAECSFLCSCCLLQFVFGECFKMHASELHWKPPQVGVSRVFPEGNPRCS